jgi:hypothetical protein
MDFPCIFHRRHALVMAGRTLDRAGRDGEENAKHFALALEWLQNDRPDIANGASIVLSANWGFKMTE